jgi:MoxR-like ATPase
VAEEGGSVTERVDGFRKHFDALTAEMGRVIVGQEEVLEQVYACLLANGNALLEGVPGLGKTLLARTFAACLGLEFSRIQFTPDLMPADITGTNILAEKDGGKREFRFQKGPVFANVVLADEINRATPKTQSALLQAMQEHRVTVGDVTYDLPEPFLVLATQNPIELEGTYPLPEAQLDRFLMKVKVEFPNDSELVKILTSTTEGDEPSADVVLSREDVLEDQKLVRKMPVGTPVAEYAARVVGATHPDRDGSPEMTKKYIRYGSSPRGGQALIFGGKARALRDGRVNVGFEDLQKAAHPALRHRLILNFEGEAAGIDSDGIVDAILKEVETIPGA